MATDSSIVNLCEVLDLSGLATLFTDGVAPASELLADHAAHRDTRVSLGAARDDELCGAIIARTPRYGVCEVLAYGVSDRSDLPKLVDAAADCLHALTIWASVDPGAAETWEAMGFSLRSDPEAPGRRRAERRHPPEPEGFFTKPHIQATGERELRVELPPEGNTLPLVPESLRHQSLPAFVLRWILDADEIGLLMQELAPDLYPPVTPAVRPPSVRSALGSLATVLGDPSIDALDPLDGVPDLPAGLRVPVALVERLAAAERITGWLREGKRVRAWAVDNGAGDAEWVANDPWQPHAQMQPELDRRP